MRYLPFMTFLILVFISLIVLPSINKNNVLPFFNWRLYADSSVATRRFDILLEREHHQFFLTRASGMSSDLREHAFYMAQVVPWLPRELYSPHPLAQQLVASFAKSGIRPIAIAVMKLPLDHYMLLDEKELQANVEIVHRF